jgi:hypothetical protein
MDNPRVPTAIDDASKNIARAIREGASSITSALFAIFVMSAAIYTAPTAEEFGVEAVAQCAEEIKNVCSTQSNMNDLPPALICGQLKTKQVDLVLFRLLMGPKRPLSKGSGSEIYGIGAFSNAWFFEIDRDKKRAIKKKACDTKKTTSPKRRRQSTP